MPPRNQDRWIALTDAGLTVLADEGSRGLTHRALDRVAGLPTGTASNYFPTREALITALVQRIEQRLAPDPDVVARLSAQPASKASFGAFVRYIVERLSTQRDVTLALFELRLEAARRPDVGAALTAWQRASFDADVEFNSAAGLPGDRREIALFHYALDGLMFDRLTSPIDPATDTEQIVSDLVERLMIE